MGEVSSQEPLLLKKEDDFDHLKKIPLLVSSTIKVIMWMIFIAWATFIFLLPTKFGKELQDNFVRATEGTIFGSTGSTFLIYRFPIFMIAFFGIIRLVLSGEDESSHGKTYFWRHVYVGLLAPARITFLGCPLVRSKSFSESSRLN